MVEHSSTWEVKARKSSQPERQKTLSQPLPPKIYRLKTRQYTLGTTSLLTFCNVAMYSINFLLLVF